MHKMFDNWLEFGGIRLVLLSLIAVFSVPLLFALLIFYNPNVFSERSTFNYGQLIDPPIPLKQLRFQILTSMGKNRERADKLFHGKWSLLYVGSGQCDLRCEANLFKMRQIRLRIGKDITRLQYLFLLSTKDPVTDLKRVRKDHPSMIITHLNDVQLQSFQQLSSDIPEHGIYLVDPLENLMMYYPTDANAKGMLKDINHLLKVSHIG